jgi:hypothetical protein
MRLFTSRGVFQNRTAPKIVGKPPFFNLIHGSEAAKAGIVIA